MDAEFKRPVDQVAEALPGTLSDVIERTGYTPAAILSALARLRAEGTPVRAIMGERDTDGWEPTIYAVDSGSRKE